MMSTSSVTSNPTRCLTSLSGFTGWVDSGSHRVSLIWFHVFPAGFPLSRLGIIILSDNFIGGSLAVSCWGDINYHCLLISIVRFTCHMSLCLLHSFYLVNYFVFLDISPPICGWWYEQNGVWQGWRDIVWVRPSLISNITTDCLFIVNLHQSQTGWQRLIFAGKTTGGEPGEGDCLDPAEPGLTEGGPDVKWRIRVSGF